MDYSNENASVPISPLELLIGADKDSEWSNGKLVIDANHGPIHLLQTAFYAVRIEVQRRSARSQAASALVR